MSFCTTSILRVNTKDTQVLLEDDKFLAFEEEIKIIPTFSTDEPFDFIKGKYGPFRAHSTTKVPLWAALELDRLQKCTIVPPAWLHEEELKIMRDDEKDKADLTKVPQHYIEISHAVLMQSKAYGSRLREKERMMLLLRELIDARRSKIVEGLKQFGTRNVEFNVSEMSAVEIGCFRTRSLHALDNFLDLLKSRRVGDKENDEFIEESQPEDSSVLPPL